MLIVTIRLTYITSIELPAPVKRRYLTEKSIQTKSIYRNEQVPSESRRPIDRTFCTLFSIAFVTSILLVNFPKYRWHHSRIADVYMYIYLHVSQNSTYLSFEYIVSPTVMFFETSRETAGEYRSRERSREDTKGRIRGEKKQERGRG